ncbi:MAG: S8 family serine peptidase [bacterium]|nr:S8 family serine peptidase [bacterium]
MCALAFRIAGGALCALLLTSVAAAPLLERRERAAEPTRESDLAAGRSGRAPTYARGSYAWPYATGPAYGNVSARETRLPGVLHTPVGALRLDDPQLRLPQELTTRNRLDLGGEQYFVVQLDPEALKLGAGAELLREVENLGGAIVRHVPVSAVIARLDAAGHELARTSPAVLRVEPYHAALKLDPRIGRVPLRDPIKALSDVYELEVALFPGEPTADAVREIEALGGSVKHVWGRVLIASLHRAKLAELASVEAVERVLEHIAPSPHGEETTTTIQTGAWRNGALPYHAAGIRGGGQVLMLLDTGIQLDARDLSDTATTPGTPGTDCANNAAADCVHRKVLLYKTTGDFGGRGDLQGCDTPYLGGFTHGHAVAATAGGWASDGLPDSYCANPPCSGVTASNPEGSSDRWKLDGVAPEVRFVVYDAQFTPATGACTDPLNDTLEPGDLYSGGATGSMGDSHMTHGARVYNFSWGSPGNGYTTNASKIDQFVFDKADAAVFVSVGNSAVDADEDGVPDAGTLHAPATAKNVVAIGASGTANDLGAGGGPESRAVLSSVGPAPGGRIAPLLMAPGEDFGDDENLGIDGEISCRSGDTDQASPVECDLRAGGTGTSHAAAAASGAALLARDWLAQGFYPDGTTDDPDNASDRVAEPSAALIKALLINSAEFMDGQNLTRRFRFNREQGYGRIRLDNVLPLEGHASSPTATLVVDGGVDGNPLDVAGLDGTLDAVGGETHSGSFTVVDAGQELRVALAWVEPPGAALINNLNLELLSPSGRLYHGNYYNDDDRDGVVNLTTEDCPAFDGTVGASKPDSAAWSLPACLRQDATLSPHDHANPTEAIHLTPDLDGDGAADADPSDDSQVEVGAWTVRVVAPGGDADPAQRYALVVTGGLGSRSSIRLDRAAYGCDDKLVVEVHEAEEDPDALDPVAGLTPSAIAERVVLQVLDGAAVVDEESLGFAQPSPSALVFRSAPVELSGATAQQPGNGVLDVRGGNSVRAVYADRVGGVADPDRRRASSAPVECRPAINSGTIAFARIGTDATVNVRGGCEVNARGLREFGFPDRYLDAGENAIVQFAFSSDETLDLENVEAALRCVVADDSKADAACLPGDALRPGCSDPLRATHAACSGSMTILNSPLRIGNLPAGSAVAPNFNVQMAPAIAGTPEVELVLEVTAATAGRPASAVAVSRQRLDVDESETLYSTDFPTGGSEIRDFNENESVENPTTHIDEFLLDYRFETRTFGDLTAGGTRNLDLRSPWNFDLSDGGFRAGIAAPTTESTIVDVIAQWGEDKNFNGLHDRRCDAPHQHVPCLSDGDCAALVPPTTCVSTEDRDPLNGVLDSNWGTGGGCGWQTMAPASCDLDPGGTFCYTDDDCIVGTFDVGPCGSAGQASGGVWHTGRIGNEFGTCLVQGAAPGQCQVFETVSGDSGERLWFELLLTPEIEKVGGDAATVEITSWAWNQAIDLPDENVFWTWEFDTDTSRLEPVDLVSDLTVLNFGSGGYGAWTQEGNPDLTNGFSMFAPQAVTGASYNGTVGNNRVGKNACFFENAGEQLGTPGPARPTDNDLAERYCQDAPHVLCNGGIGDCTAAGLAGPCVQDNAIVDEYVKTNGPLRNMDLLAFNGLDMRYLKLEDLFGPTGDTFRAAVGMINYEKAEPEDPNPALGYGVAVDDMLVEWREFELVDDATDCDAVGQCAQIHVQTTNVYGPSATLEVSVLEPTHDLDTDCDLDGAGDGVDDCDGDLRREIVVRAETDRDADSPESFLLEETSAGSGVYVGSIPFSAAYDAPGILHGRAVDGTDPEVTLSYTDGDDGAGQECRNHVDPSQRGVVEARTTVFLRTGSIVVTGTLLTDNADDDGWADTNETVEMRVGLLNKTGIDLTGCTATLTALDANVDCVIDAFIHVGDLGAGAGLLTTESFRFHVASAVDRQAEGLSDLDALVSELDIAIQCNEIDGLAQQQKIVLDLDLDAVGGAGATTYFEGFEVPNGFGSFTTMNLDFGFVVDGDTSGNNDRSDGYRCQYNDPDHTGGASYGQITDCYIGPNAATADAYFWQVHHPSDIDGGRAFAGTRSLYMGIFGATPDGHTTPLATLEAAGSDAPINLGWEDVSPQLSIKHQISLIDERSVNAPPGESADRGVVHVQVADSGGNPVGDWIKLEPYFNLHDQQATDNYSNCFFDPIDDGNTEDHYFDPGDPDRRLGPSSMCYPEFSFVYLGDTFDPFAIENTGNAEGPGLAGSHGLGTWVESRFSLDRFRGRRVRLRFMTSGIKVGTYENYEALFGYNPDPGDDGWWIDDVTVSDTLTTPATMSVDSTDNSALPACGAACDGMSAALAADPPGPATPGQPVELDASASAALDDRCVDGVLQYRFTSDTGGLLRDWTDDPTYLDAPRTDTLYGVDVRCSADFACADAASVTFDVDCPAGPPIEVAFDDGDAFGWDSGVDRWLYAQGTLSTLGADRTPTDSGATSSDCSAAGGGAHCVTDVTPGPGDGAWWLVRPFGTLDELCNLTWSSGGAAEQPGRDGSDLP